MRVDDWVWRWVLAGAFAVAAAVGVLTINSNEPGLIAFQVGRAAHPLPQVGEDLAAFERILRENPGSVGVVLPLHARDIRPEQWVRCLSLQPLVASPRGVVPLPAKVPDGLWGREACTGVGDA